MSPAGGPRRGPDVCAVGGCWAKRGEVCIYPGRLGCLRRQPPLARCGHPLGDADPCEECRRCPDCCHCAEQRAGTYGAEEWPEALDVELGYDKHAERDRRAAAEDFARQARSTAEWLLGLELLDAAVWVGADGAGLRTSDRLHLAEVRALLFRLVGDADKAADD